MPTYEYSCTSCHRTFEVVQGFNDERLTVCEECGGILKRVFHPVGIVLKGSGFYATDNRSGKRATPKEPAKTETTADKKTETKTEKKADPKTESKPAPKKASGESS